MFYVAFYDLIKYSSESRSVAPAAADVVRYMADIMSEDRNIEIVCPARTTNQKGKYKKRTTAITEKISLTLPFTFGVNSPIGRVLSVAYNQLWLFFYLLNKTSKNETVVVYHSLSYMKVIKLLKKIKNWHLILEVREIYSDVKDSYESLKKVTEKQRKKELSFFNQADAFIFPTELLNELINNSKKPYVIATGIYESRERISESKQDDIIHVVYAGTLSKEKGGAAAATAAAAYLDSRFHIHILGYGSDREIEEINAAVAHAQTANGAKVSYDGLLRGDEFTAFIQSCQIGLATQDTRGSFNDTSFPSKVLMYLSNGLQVLCGRIRVVEQSAVGRYCYYYDEQTPECIAKAIIELSEKNDRQSAQEALEQLDFKLRTEIKSILNN